MSNWTDKIRKYTELTGKDGTFVAGTEVEAYLDGYNKGIKALNKSEKDLELECYRLIRRRANTGGCFNDGYNDTELASYVHGVVDLQTELYKMLEEAKDDKQGEI